MSGLNANTADHPLHPLGHQGQFALVSHPVTTSVNLNGTLQYYKKTNPIHLETSAALSAVISQFNKPTVSHSSVRSYM